jgi:hypothetical protein
LYQKDNTCGVPPDGWYPRIHYTGAAAMMDSRDMVVADVHTIPTDELGGWVGWVKHVGTGPVNLAVVKVSLPDGRVAAFAGPVMSYYEHLTSGFKRLTDEEWKTACTKPPSVRPSFVNLYLADAAGGSRGSGPMLLTGVVPPDETAAVPACATLSAAYPNPFNSTTNLQIIIPPRAGAVRVELTIHTVHGQQVRHLLGAPLGSGSYIVRWDGRDDRSASAASGVYLVKLRSGENLQVRKLVLIR